jgi:hypothetical protein
MKSKAIVVISILLSQYAIASAITTAKFFPIPEGRINQENAMESTHTYSIKNETSSNQSISLCFEIISCPEYTNYLKSTRNCQSFDLPAGETKSGQQNVIHKFTIPFRGYCHAIAKTETTGGNYSVSVDDQSFQTW